jgi:hypothetical protein
VNPPRTGSQDDTNDDPPDDFEEADEVRTIVHVNMGLCKYT